MKHCKFMLGNSSSGFVEASYFLKYVINVGDRQKGRILTKNIVSCSFDKKSIYEFILLGHIEEIIKSKKELEI